MGRQKREPPPKSYDQAIVEIEMLDSLNRKYGTTSNSRDGRRIYIRKEYREAEEKGVSKLKEQLAFMNKKRDERGAPLWNPSSTDRYIIFYSFDFTDEIKQDIHNPLKATCDLLKKAKLIFEDNRVCQEILVKNPLVRYPTAIITIYKFHELVYQPAPFQQMYEAWLAQEYPDSVPKRIAV